MPELELSQWIFLVAVVLYTLAAAISDFRSRKIPNALTVPMLVAGLTWQGAFFGFAGLKTGLLAFAAGFGILFVLWMVGSAGGGDVKLLGGLSVWLGTSLTLKVLLSSLLFVVIGTAAVIGFSVLSKGFRGTRVQYVKGRSGAVKSETSEDRSKRRVMAFAIPVALATWCVLVLFRNQW